MRIWGDRDSSNDVRSSDEELDETGKRLSVENYEGQREEREIPNSDVEREEVSIFCRWGKGTHKARRRGERRKWQLANLGL
jgi:hypothetical protein